LDELETSNKPMALKKTSLTGLLFKMTHHAVSQMFAQYISALDACSLLSGKQFMDAVQQSSVISNTDIVNHSTTIQLQKVAHELQVVREWENNREFENDLSEELV